MKFQNSLKWFIVGIVTVLMMTVCACSGARKSVKLEERRQNLMMEFTDTCYFQGLLVVDSVVFRCLDSVLSAYENCKYCDNDYPNYFLLGIGGGANFEEPVTISISNHNFLALLEMQQDASQGGFYYKERLFIVGKNDKKSLFIDAGIPISVNKCDFNLMNSCLTFKVRDPWGTPEFSTKCEAPFKIRDIHQKN